MRALTKAIVFCAAIVCFPAAFADMMKDSPVKFPEKGALPSKYPPDVKTKREVPEPEYSIFETPERSLEQIAKIQSEMVRGEFTPPKPDWKYLPRTRRILTFVSKGNGKYAVQAKAELDQLPNP